MRIQIECADINYFNSQSIEVVLTKFLVHNKLLRYYKHKGKKMTRKTKKDSKMRKQKSTGFKQRFDRIPRSSLILVSVFVLVFMGVGGYFVKKSHASSGCVNTVLQVGSYGYCTQVARTMLNAIHNAHLNHFPDVLPLDPTLKNYNVATSNDVWNFQYDNNHYTNYGGITQDGIIGNQTWWHLCKVDVASLINRYAYIDANCQSFNALPVW